jgi:hypothetical protein
MKIPRLADASRGISVILRPRRTAPARTPSHAGRRILPRKGNKPGRGSGHGSRGLGCRGALTRPRLCSSTLSHKQRGRGGTHQGVWRFDEGRRMPRPPPIPNPSPANSAGEGSQSSARGQPARKRILLSPMGFMGERPGEGGGRGMRQCQPKRGSGLPSPAKRGDGGRGEGAPLACAGSLGFRAAHPQPCVGRGRSPSMIAAPRSPAPRFCWT